MGILYVVRHGETDKNKSGLVLGQAEVELNDIGVQQAHELGSMLKDLKIDGIVSSSMVRALQTARILNSYLGKDISIEPRLIERNMGTYEGLTFQEMREIYQKGFTSQMAYDHTPSDGESSEQVEERVFSVIDELVDKRSNEILLIVAHSFIIRMIYKYFNPDITADDFFHFSLKNAEVRKFIF